MSASTSRNLNRVQFAIWSFAISAAVTLAFSACAFKKSEPTPPTTAENVVDKLKLEKSREAVDGILTKDNVSINFVENPMPNSYRMVVRWPSSIRNVTFRINDGSPQIKNNTEVAEFAVKGDEGQKIEMVAYGTVSPAPLSSVVLNQKSPKDLVVSDVFNLLEDRTLTANRLFIHRNGQVITNGFQLTINANKIFIEKDDRAKNEPIPFTTLAKILTFIPGTVAAADRDLKGSVITINAREAHGDLRIAMVGANGRAGISGEERERNLKDAPSRKPAVPRAEDRGAAGAQSADKLGSGVGTSRGGFDSARQPSLGVCTRQPADGVTGPEGARGIQGGKGEQGGSCGILVLNIEDSKDLRVEVRQKTGTPGKGGEGGPGFPGGLGGLPGNQPEKCNAASSGSQGPTGPKGQQGDSGDPGDTANIPRGSTPVSILEL